MRGVTRS